ncbi:FAD-binding and (Fe-S)-binding domain-containing protein [Nocardioides jiangxiensis]|uniref:FAD-binding and (Fe-S)-binding domain-containing protein n=1 Tax=Nocardioides jiangxiensis TaxID=3064524 RepID=A0ABT9B089_9ACTN|nr:FAD-binding and (Fe-S)-binding domain-containing protein [Nocardioides sp. WY-20]MDO7867719.1 FAD-binding and (Fe-S)-binding domain-containing protein [Nocardioides sp. WY-20]
MTHARDLVAALRRAGVAGASDATLDRALYAGDASLYRVVPQAVAKPRSREELLACLAVAREAGVPLTMRGAGTSIAGNAVGPGLVVDTSRLDRLLAVDREERTARVEPGLVQASLQRVVVPHGLRFGPDPSTHTRCTLGGMIGNNACGARALGFGRTSENVLGLEVAFGNGSVESLGPGSAGPTAERLAALGAAALGPIRTQFGHFARQGSGYALEHLLPERLAPHRLLVGSEGTLGVVLSATVALVEEPAARVLLLVGYPTMAEAADAVPAVLVAAPVGMLALEGLDARIVDVVRARGGAVPALPRGGGWLFAELAADSLAEAVARATQVARAARGLEHRMVVDPAEQSRLWQIREDGAGLAGRSLGRPAYSGWEDAAVPPERLGTWLRQFDELLAGHGLQGVPYGHFGDGCVHARIDFTFDDGGARFRAFLSEAARAVAALGGSLSGEHGDGRARSELLPLMYDDAALDLFGQVKRICDPEGLLNPGVLVDPAPVDADLRPARPVTPVRARLQLGETLGEAVHRCTGVGKCVATGGSGVMCPSWRATRDEKDSTRGRARVLQEALDGSLVTGLDDPAVHAALDLCLACKGCSSDCPAGVDMAAYKVEALQQQYAGWRTVRRPREHRTLGWLPRWARVSPPALVNRVLDQPLLARLAARAAGVDVRRALPRFAPQRLRDAATEPAGSPEPDVWIWADTFTDRFTPSAGLAALRVLEQAGLRARVIPADACCGLTWLATGQADGARRTLARAVERLHTYVAGGVPVVGLEPSCLATLRDDAERVLPGERTAVVARGVRTLAELLGSLDDWQPRDMTGVEVVAQPHCHHASVLGWAADEALLRRAGATLTRVEGCCGLAGSFGVTPEHHDVSVAIAGTALLPAVRAAGPDAVVLADGFSCRYQLDDLAGVRALHLAELLAGPGH